MQVCPAGEAAEAKLSLGMEKQLFSGPLRALSGVSKEEKGKFEDWLFGKASAAAVGFSFKNGGQNRNKCRIFFFF